MAASICAERPLQVTHQRFEGVAVLVGLGTQKIVDMQTRTRRSARPTSSLALGTHALNGNAGTHDPVTRGPGPFTPT